MFKTAQVMSSDSSFLTTETRVQSDALQDPLQLDIGTPQSGSLVDGLVSGSGGDIPHKAAIQQSFGPYDIDGIEAHTDGATRKKTKGMGAKGFATSKHVGFSDAPSLHTAAHEAAHVMQQQSGLTLENGVGRSDDRHERHADAVADRVVAGESATELLSEYGPPSDVAALAGPVQFDADEDAADAYVNEARPFLANMQGGCAEPMVRARIGAEVDALAEAIAGYDGNPGYKIVWVQNVREAKRALTRGGDASLARQAVAIRNTRQGMEQRNDDTDASLAAIDPIRDAALTAAQTSFSTAAQRQALADAQAALVPIRLALTSRRAPLQAAMGVYIDDDTSRTQAETAVAGQAIGAYDAVPAPGAHAVHVAAGQAVLDALSGARLRDLIQPLYAAAVADPAKRLDLSDAQCLNAAARMVDAGRTRDEVVADVDRRVATQHNPDKGVWLSVIGLDVPRNNLWLKRQVGTINGTDVHASLFKDNIPNNSDVNMAGPALKNRLLGIGTDGFHVTLEHFAAGNNPHSYRGGAHRRNGYPVAAPGIATAAAMQVALDGYRNAEVATAEANIDAFKARLGRRR